MAGRKRDKWIGCDRGDFGGTTWTRWVCWVALHIRNGATCGCDSQMGAIDAWMVENEGLR